MAGCRSAASGASDGWTSSWPLGQAHPGSVAIRDWRGAAEFLERTHGLPAPLPIEDVASFLASWGFPAADSATWRTDDAPQLRIRVPTHGELGGQQHYAVACELLGLRGDRTFSWVGMRTLHHLRAGLHDPVKEALGGTYTQHFAASPFARHLGPPGTTARLEAWCGRLATCANAQLLPPSLLAQVLRLLDIPT